MWEGPGQAGTRSGDFLIIEQRIRRSSAAANRGIVCVRVSILLLHSVNSTYVSFFTTPSIFARIVFTDVECDF